MPVIMITAYGTIENAVQAMRQGAFDYITKPFNRDELRMTLDKALRMRRLEKENVELRAEVTDRYRFEKHRRKQRQDQGSARPGRAGGRERCDAADHGRERDGQGTSR